MPGFAGPLDSWEKWAAAGLVLILAEAVYACFGFGAGLIAVGLLALVFADLQDVVVILLLVNLPIEIVIVARSWRQVHWKGAALICAGVAAGAPLGALSLRQGRPVVLLDLLGGFLVLAGVILLCTSRTSRLHHPPPAWSAAPVGVLAGFLGGLFGTGGPPLIVYYRLAGLDKTAFRGTLMAVFLSLTVVKIPAYLLAGLVTMPRVSASLALLPAVLVGLWLGSLLHIELSERTFGRAVSLLLVLLGVGLLCGL